MEKVIKLALAVLFLLCLADMPYGYYQFVRFLALIGFGFLAWEAGQKNRSTDAMVYVALAILFQPIFKIALGRATCLFIVMRKVEEWRSVLLNKKDCAIKV